MDRINLRSRFIYIPAIIIGLALVIFAGWWLSQERLPGYNVDKVQKSSFVEPSGAVSEYFTGTLVTNELSILGPKLTVKMDTTDSNRTFFLPEDAPVWIGMVFGDKEITGAEKGSYYDLKVGQRVAVFVEVANRAKRINILKR